LHLCNDNYAAGKRPGVTEHCFARSTSEATKGWATINALQFLESEPWINILTIRASKPIDASYPILSSRPALDGNGLRLAGFGERNHPGVCR
jgi:hypothetical protein